MSHTNHSSSALAGYQSSDGWLHRWEMITRRLVWILGLVAACGLMAQEPGDTTVAIEGESLLEEVFEDRISLLQDTLFLRQEQLEAANFTLRQLQQSVAGLSDTLGQVRVALVLEWPRYRHRTGNSLRLWPRRMGRVRWR